MDIFAFGLCVLELATLQRMDRDNAGVWPELLATVGDDEAQAFIQRCCALWPYPRASYDLCYESPALGNASAFIPHGSVDTLVHNIKP